jgi:hypothetical protein
MKTCTKPQKYSWERNRSRDLNPCKLDDDEEEEEEEEENDDDNEHYNTKRK